MRSDYYKNNRLKIMEASDKSIIIKVLYRFAKIYPYFSTNIKIKLLLSTF